MGILTLLPWGRMLGPLAVAALLAALWFSIRADAVADHEAGLIRDAYAQEKRADETRDDARRAGDSELSDRLRRWAVSR